MSVQNMSRAERLRRLYFHEEMDRPAAIIRWWGFRNDRSYGRLFQLMVEEADWVEPWFASALVQPVAADWMAPAPETTGKHYRLKSLENAERYLELPLPEIAGDGAEFFRIKEKVGERGIVLVHLGDNPGGQVAGLFGSEQFALFSVLERDLIHRLLARQQEVLLRLVRHLVDLGIGPFFNICGQEMIAPPLHGRQDFFEFNVRYDRAISDAIHQAGGRFNVHCHGSIATILDGFVEMGADVMHCFEAPPMGNVTPAQAKNAWRGKIALEGNLQIHDMYERTPEEIAEQTRALIRDAFDDHHGLAVTPTASPFMHGEGERCYAQYAAMLAATRGDTP
jgi:hypothetical protein